MTARRTTDILGSAAFLCGIGPQVVALGCFLVARKLWRWWL